MRGFEAFDISAWMDGALFIWHESVGRAAKVAKPASKRALLAASAVVVSVSAIAMPTTVGGVTSFAAASWPSGGRLEGDRDAVPVGYFHGLMAEMRTWQRVPESDSPLADLEPLL